MLVTRRLESAATRLVKKTLRDPYLSLIIRETKDYEQAQNEYRWLREHDKVLRGPDFVGPAYKKAANRQSLLNLCMRRSRGEPIQYIMGSQPFGNLNIKCRPGVLIPRPETEAYTTYLASRIHENLLEKQLRALSKSQRSTSGSSTAGAPTINILDACSGSGCISLLLYQLLSESFKPGHELRIDGVDISSEALLLAKENLDLNITEKAISIEAATNVRYRHCDILAIPEPDSPLLSKDYHIIISNPPYISKDYFSTKLPRSVRAYEPETALIPPPRGENVPEDVAAHDIFYHALINLYQLQRQAFMLVMEVGHENQAKRVIDMARRYFQIDSTNEISVWRDFPSGIPSGEDLVVENGSIPTEGQGNVRTVVFMRNMDDIEW